MSFVVKEAQTDEEILSCWDVVLSLRTHLKSKEDYLAQVREQQKEGFHLLYTEDAGTGTVASYIGYRVFTMLYYGKVVYIEDLATLPEFRGKGHAKELFIAVKGRAKEIGCDVVTVDSHISRHTAHRFYLNQGCDITCHHFEIRGLQKDSN